MYVSFWHLCAAQLYVCMYNQKLVCIGMFTIKHLRFQQIRLATTVFIHTLVTMKTPFPIGIDPFGNKSVATLNGTDPQWQAYKTPAQLPIVSPSLGGLHGGVVL